MITLRPITWDNYMDVLKLQVAESQKGFVASNSESLAEAYLDMVDADGDPFITLAIYNGEEAVGFIMSARDDDHDYENDTEPCYFINRFMVDEEFQGRGFGKAAMEQFVQYLKSTWPRGEAVHLYLGYKESNHAARKFYTGLGFAETGEIKYGDELVTRLKL